MNTLFLKKLERECLEERVIRILWGLILRNDALTNPYLEHFEISIVILRFMYIFVESRRKSSIVGIEFNV